MTEKYIHIIILILYILAAVALVWIDWRLIIPFMLFGWAMNLENSHKE